VSGASFQANIWSAAQKNPPNHQAQKNRQKKRAESSQRKKIPNRKEAQDGRPGVHCEVDTKGLSRAIKVLFSIEKSGLSHDR
jgi:hypothetical protein